MRLLARLSCLFGLWVYPIAGCNPLETPTPTFSAELRVLEPQGLEGSRQPLEGVEFCDTDTGNCAVSDADGEATLEFPIDEEVSYTVTKDGYHGYLVPDVTDETANQGDFSFTMYRHENWARFYDALMSPYPQMGTGTVWLFVGPAREGVTFELIGATGKRFYEQPPEPPSSDLEATTSFGWGGFVQVPPDEAQVDIGGSASRCVPARGWPGDQEDRLRFPIRAGYVTWATATCPPP
jgi:hypothetical protein